MEWYWWILIVVALAGFILLKVKLGGAWLKKQKAKKNQREKTMEDED